MYISLNKAVGQYTCIMILCCLQAHRAVELVAFCEGYFLQNMVGLMERECFRGLVLGSGGRWGPGRDSPLDGLEATLAQRVRSLYVTSQV